MLHDFFKLFLDYSISTIPFFLVALLISAIIGESLPDKVFEKVLNHKGILFVILSSVLGALIPLCTCGMIPLASKLQKKGVPWLIAISFLTAGNASSITSILLTITLGLKITLFRFLFAVIFGIVAAYIFVLFFKPSIKKNPSVETIHAASGPASLSLGEAGEPRLWRELSLPKKIIYEFLGLLKSFGPWVLAALFMATVIALYLKVEDVIGFAGVKNLASSFLLSLAGFPFYFCAGSDIPISKALLSKGASIGSVLSFMTASPGINLTSFLIYWKWIGFKNSLVYLAISFLVCGILGLLVNIVMLPIS